MRHFPNGYERDFLGWLFPILMLALVAGLVLLTFMALRRRPAAMIDVEPLRGAAARYAAGEIDRVEFERIQQDLGARPAAATPLEDAALRLAHGEITTDEFDTIKDRLSTDGS